jgi:hypothetical protein
VEKGVPVTGSMRAAPPAASWSKDANSELHSEGDEPGGLAEVEKMLEGDGSSTAARSALLPARCLLLQFDLQAPIRCVQATYVCLRCGVFQRFFCVANVCGFFRNEN